MTDQEEGQILIVTEAAEPRSGRPVERGLAERLTGVRVRAVDASVLNRNMRRFFDQLRDLIDAGATEVGSFAVSEVEVSAQITAEGKVCLIGSGGAVAVQGGVKFVLRRREG